LGSSGSERGALSNERSYREPLCFEVCALSVVSSSPERPCDDVCWHDPFSREFDGEAAISWIDQRISEAAALL